MERKKSVKLVWIGAMVILVALPIALLVMLAGSAPARASSLPGEAWQAAGSQAYLDASWQGRVGLQRIPSMDVTTGQRASAPSSQTADRCAKCHPSPSAYHYGLACGQCHTAASFLPAKVMRPSHPIKLVGEHATLECSTCHKPGKAPATDCSTCHSAPKGHLTGACSACHGPEGWAESAATAGISGPAAPHLLAAADDCLLCHAPAGPNWPVPAGHRSYTVAQCLLCHDSAADAGVTVVHEVANLFQGRHTELACAECHTDGQLAGTPETCSACHQPDDRHGGQFGQDCGRCHTPNGWGGATFDHSQTGFGLAGAHSSAACTGCHGGGRYDGTPTSCVACHQADDRHGGQYGQDCAGCHRPDGWGGAAFDHGQTGFSLTGAHSSAGCVACHTNGQFNGTPRECAACHSEPAYHAGTLGTSCATCHQTGGWLPASYSGPHGFPLGHKGASSCRTCHPGSLAGYTCYACHNQGEIAEKHTDHDIPDFGNCVGCHPSGDD